MQGGSNVVYFTLPASSATLRFNGKQYPMVQDGSRWYAEIGIGAFADLGPYAVTVSYVPAGSSATVSVASTIQVQDVAYPTENIDLDPDTSQLLDPTIVNNELAFRSQIYSGYTMQRYWSGTFVRPTGAAIGDIYGIARGYNGAPPSSYHTGTDFVANTGDVVVAAGAGRVVFAGALQVRGNSVIIDHGLGVFTAYHHLSRIDVQEGAMVNAGQQIGLVGSTGLVTGPHLHWEVIIRGIEVDGRQWLQSDLGP